MESMAELIKRHKIVIQDPILRDGFTQFPNRILKDKRLTTGARLTYAILLSYAWQKDYCFPGQETLAADVGVSRQMLNKYLNELQKLKYVAWKRVGLGKTNTYYILKIDDVPGLM